MPNLKPKVSENKIWNYFSKIKQLSQKRKGEQRFCKSQKRFFRNSIVVQETSNRRQKEASKFQL